MHKWNSSPHPISDIRDWHELGRLELRPDFQRRAVWNFAAKVMLIDTILNKIPMPKIFVSAFIKDNKTYRAVIDGQQRIGTILSYMNDDFILSSPYEGLYLGLTFSKLPGDVQEDFLQYSIDFNEAINVSDEQARAVYSRVNKYTFALNKQELRIAEYPGDFLELSELFAFDKFLDDIKLFTVANRRRYTDVEYISELLAGMLGGVQDKKEKLDEFYLEYRKIEPAKLEKLKTGFRSVLKDLSKIFEESFLDIRKTRFKQKSDFYSLFLLIYFLKDEGFSLEGKDLKFLREDLRFLDMNIEPESGFSLLSEYAIKCVSQANTINSRKWREGFLYNFLIGTYGKNTPGKEVIEVLISLYRDSEDPMCPANTHVCAYCGKEIDDVFDGKKATLTWPDGADVYQFSNSIWVHADCDQK